MISLDGITFDEGIHIIRGRVGSGKSTLARRLTEDAEFFGNRRILLFQEIEYHLTEDTVGKEIASWNVTGDEPAFTAFGQQDLTRDPYTLSRGELKRLLLSCILSSDADCLILDEPYSSLDSDAKEILTELIRGRSGVTILFTHEMPNLDAVLWEISEGKLCRM
ncbi:MAG TPA: ATP-binding cassette domain-containing protein [Methanocorpusculum sp.]|nr:ATP-binding cassette domain-containing protein [Methanocorpusculum sp.]